MLGRRYQTASVILTAQKLAFRDYAAVHAAKRVQIERPAPTAHPQKPAVRPPVRPVLAQQPREPAVPEPATPVSAGQQQQQQTALKESIKPVPVPASSRQTRSPAASRRALLTSPPVCGDGTCDAGESCG